jgi:large subunit ribosomal protein L15
MQRRLPKRGFKNPFRIEAFPVNVGWLSERFEDGTVVDLDALRRSGLVPKKARLVKVLGAGEVTVKLTVKAHRFSKTAQQKLEAAGGSVELVGKGAGEVEAEAQSETAQS